MKKIEELYTEGDLHTGETNYYLDKELSQPYTGKVVDESQGIIIWEFYVVNGQQEGVEKIYDENGNLEQICEYKGNLQFGVSKEYNEKGNLSSVSIVWNNGYLKTIFIEIDKIEKKEVLNKTIIPDKIKYLLDLDNEELINYSFE